MKQISSFKQTKHRHKFTEFFFKTLYFLIYKIYWKYYDFRWPRTIDSHRFFNFSFNFAVWPTIKHDFTTLAHKHTHIKWTRDEKNELQKSPPFPNLITATQDTSEHKQFQNFIKSEIDNKHLLNKLKTTKAKNTKRKTTSTTADYSQMANKMWCWKQYETVMRLSTGLSPLNCVYLWI